MCYSVGGIMGIVAVLMSFNAGGGEWTMHPSSKRYRDLRGVIGILWFVVQL